MKFFKFNDQGKEIHLNLDHLFSYSVEKASYGTFFILDTASGRFNLDNKEQERFLELIVKLEVGTNESE